jgi:hypothetical protein
MWHFYSPNILKLAIYINHNLLMCFKSRKNSLSTLIIIIFNMSSGSMLKIWGEEEYNLISRGVFFAHLSQPHFEGSVRSPLTFPKMGLGSPSRLPKTQNAIVGVKTPRIEMFFIPLEKARSVDVQNGLAWVIWTSTTQVIGERKVRSQTGNLTPDH